MPEVPDQGPEIDDVSVENLLEKSRMLFSGDSTAGTNTPGGDPESAWLNEVEVALEKHLSRTARETLEIALTDFSELSKNKKLRTRAKLILGSDAFRETERA